MNDEHKNSQVLPEELRGLQSRNADLLDTIGAIYDKLGLRKENVPPSELVSETVRRHVEQLVADRDRLTAERDKLQAFKNWVHGYLDSHEVPHHPPGTHGAEGCRIGDRMDWLMQQIDRLKAEVERLKKESAWVRKKLDLPEDTPFVSGNSDTLAGAMHVVCAHAHGYITYIEAYRCDDKQGEIARLTVRAEAAESELAALKAKGGADELTAVPASTQNKPPAGQSSPPSLPDR